MWLSLFCLLLIAGIAFFQSIHGLLSSVIFCVLTIVCAALAFALYEYVAYEYLIGWKPNFALPISLMLCFTVPLIVSRVAMDQMIRRSSLLPAVVDKIGGVLFGIVTAMLIVGMVTVAAQMLPFGGSFLDLARFDRPPREGQSEDEEERKWDPEQVQEAAKRLQEADDNRILLSPDRFAVRFATMFSEGVFSGRRSFGEDHPDLLVEIGWAQAINADSLHLAQPGSVGPELVQMQITDYVYKKTLPTRSNPQTEYEPQEPKPGYEFWVASLTPNSKAEDSDGVHRFTLPQIRLVGRDRSDRPVQHIPCAIRDDEAPDKHVREIRKGRKLEYTPFKLWSPDDDGDIEVVFEVPKDFQPGYIAYKTGALVEVKRPAQDDVHLPSARDEASAVAENGDEEEDEAERPLGRSARGPDRRRRSGAGRGSSRQSRDRVSGARASGGESFFSDELPPEQTLTDYSGREIDVRHEALRSGHVIAVLALQGERDTRAHVSRFEVPSGKKLLHLDVEVLRARSTLGKALGFSVRTIRNYLVTDDAGKRYEMVGQYALANVDGDDMLEIQYFPEQIGSMGRGVGRFTEIKRRHLEQGDTTLVYLYLIDEGRQVIRFSTGSSGRGAVDLTDDDLVAQ